MKKNFTLRTFKTLFFFIEVLKTLDLLLSYFLIFNLIALLIWQNNFFSFLFKQINLSFDFELEKKAKKNGMKNKKKELKE